MYLELLKDIGLSPNEAQIYEALLRRGESTVAAIATAANIHRRNVYDALNRLTEKGFVSPILGQGDNRYAAVDPAKLRETLEEKQQKLDTVLPAMLKLFKEHRPEESAYIYKGVEGYKNFLRDILQIGDDVYTIGAKGAWADKRLEPFLASFWKEAKRKGIKFSILFDANASAHGSNLAKQADITYRFLPPKYASAAAIDIYGNRVVMQSGSAPGALPEHLTLFMLVSRDLAESFRTWFKLMWTAGSPKY